MLYTCVLLASILLFYMWHKRNAVLVDIDYFAGVVQLPLSIAILLAFAIGIVLVVCILWPSLASLRLRLALARKQRKQQSLAAQSKGTSWGQDRR
ncbi:MAG: LapA family protein [Candidatus Porifericomitaceae bacterium WSBS_2022_MAG_OTU9]